MLIWEEWEGEKGRRGGFVTLYDTVRYGMGIGSLDGVVEKEVEEELDEDQRAWPLSNANMPRQQ